MGRVALLNVSRISAHVQTNSCGAKCEVRIISPTQQAWHSLSLICNIKMHEDIICWVFHLICESNLCHVSCLWLRITISTGWVSAKRRRQSNGARAKNGRKKDRTIRRTEQVDDFIQGCARRRGPREATKPGPPEAERLSSRLQRRNPTWLIRQELYS